MTHVSPSSVISTFRRRARSRGAAARAACAWAVIFALMSLYWAAGGLIGGETLGAEIDRLAHERDASFVSELWAAFAHALMATGAISAPDALGTHALPWHLALWDPFWLVGGLLFLVATRGFQKSPQAGSARRVGGGASGRTAGSPAGPRVQDGAR
jgi:hypothetical protein